MVRALAGGVLVSLSCAVIGTFVVLRGLAFIGDALSHGVLPGVAIALLLGLPGLVGAAAGSLAMILGIGYITRRSNLSSDTAIGLLFVGMLALGVVIVSRSRSFSGDLIRILFGEVLGISWADVGGQAAAALMVCAVALVCRRPFLLLSFSPEQADVSGFPSKRYHSIMLLMIALTIVVSFKTVGTLLVFGLLIAPAASAALYAKKIGSMMAMAWAIGIFSIYAGLLASYHLNIAGGASIALASTLVFFALFAGKRITASRKLRYAKSLGARASKAGLP
ncbi:MAG TPA: metal ABC transporter permease [Rectinemataceae bacterium]|nr:metal ABC transporter permease [Rectinemataceae bacterium]